MRQAAPETRGLLNALTSALRATSLSEQATRAYARQVERFRGWYEQAIGAFEPTARPRWTWLTSCFCRLGLEGVDGVAGVQDGVDGGVVVWCLDGEEGVSPVRLDGSDLREQVRGAFGAVGDPHLGVGRVDVYTRRRRRRSRP